MASKLSRISGLCKLKQAISDIVHNKVTVFHLYRNNISDEGETVTLLLILRMMMFITSFILAIFNPCES